MDKQTLEELYINKKLSMHEIAVLSNCSINKVSYWMNKHSIMRRTISDAIYGRNNPGGDPFKQIKISTLEDAELLGFGLGLYWGEGTKSNKFAIRLGNTDPQLIEKFIEFLTGIFGVSRSDMKFGLQIFSDISPSEAMMFWTKKLNIKASQFYKITVTISGSLGTYRKKSQYGVLTVYYHNKKLRDLIVSMLPL